MCRHRRRCPRRRSHYCRRCRHHCRRCCRRSRRRCRRHCCRHCRLHCRPCCRRSRRRCRRHCCRHCRLHCRRSRRRRHCRRHCFHRKFLSPFSFSSRKVRYTVQHTTRVAYLTVGVFCLQLGCHSFWRFLDLSENLSTSGRVLWITPG